MNISRKKEPQLPLIKVIELGDHSVPTPKGIELPVRRLLHQHGLTEGEWELKVRRAKIAGTAFSRGKVRVLDPLLNRIIDLIVQPGLMGSRRRAHLVVPLEYSIEEVMSRLRPEKPIVLLTSRNGTTIDTEGNVISQVVMTERKAAKERNDARLAKQALRFWDERKNLIQLGELIEGSLVTFAGSAGLSFVDLKAAIERVWNTPSNVDKVFPLLLGSLSDKGEYISAVVWGQTKIVSLTEKGWIWIQDAREHKQLKESRFRDQRVQELQFELTALAQRKQAVLKKHGELMTRIDDQEAVLLQQLAELG